MITRAPLILQHEDLLSHQVSTLLNYLLVKELLNQLLSIFEREMLPPTRRRLHLNYQQFTESI